MRGDECRRVAADRIGARDEIGFVRLEEAKHRAQHRWIGSAGTKLGWIEAGHIEQPVRPRGITDRPGERSQGQRHRVMPPLIICVVRAHRLELRSTSCGEMRVTKRVLIVEDNELNLKLFCDLLRAHGFETAPLRDGREAVTTARAFSPDLVITDIQLPHISGLDIIARMKSDSALKSVPIMAVTAYAGHEDEARIRAAGANAYVTKPISLMRFIEEVQAML